MNRARRQELLKIADVECWNGYMWVRRAAGISVGARRYILNTSIYAPFPVLYRKTLTWSIIKWCQCQELIHTGGKNHVWTSVAPPCSITQQITLMSVTDWWQLGGCEMGPVAIIIVIIVIIIIQPMQVCAVILWNGTSDLSAHVETKVKD